MQKMTLLTVFLIEFPRIVTGITVIVKSYNFIL